MQVILYIGFFLFVIRTILFWTSLWQVKEYRWDRLWVHLKETRQGRKLLFSPYTGILALSLLAYGFVIFNDSLMLWDHLLIIALFIVLGSFFLQSVRTFSFARPRLTVKSFLIAMLSLFFISVFALFPLLDVYVWTSLLALVIPLFVAFFVAIFSFPSEIYTDILMQRAKKKLKKYRKIKVIAVSGSYGKSSTKEYIAQVLQHNFLVVRTPLSNNTPIGIAKTILRDITKDTQVFVVEMGAYKKGEIEKLCEIVSPYISITTAISDQHLSLYGSVDNIIDSEKELIDALPKKGVALMNANSPLMFSLITKVKKDVLLYGTGERDDMKDMAIGGFEIKARRNQVNFFVKIGRKTFPFSSPLLGAHTIENILPAIYIAKSLGMSIEDIQKAVKMLQPLPKTMKKIILKSGAIAVDDTYNASPESVLSALSYMRIYPKKKVFVMAPLIELGKNARKRHMQIGRELAVCTKVFLTNKNFSNDIIKGLQSVDAKTKVVLAPKTSVVHQLKHGMRKGDIVIFEGKEAGSILRDLL